MNPAFTTCCVSRRKALTIAAASVASLALVGCSGGTSPEPQFKTYLDGSRLSLSGDRVVYTSKQGKVAKTGIDVSEHQGYINWHKVAADDIDFAFIRLGNRGITEGGLYPDAYVSYNISAATTVGLEVHAYFFSQALTEAEAIEEADYAMQLARDNGLTTGYIAFDLETDAGRSHGMSDSAMATVAKAFCKRIEQGGFKSLVYGNKNTLPSFGSAVWNSAPIWLAQYTYQNPESPCAFTLWQYASDGWVNGIDGDVDLNVWIEE